MTKFKAGDRALSRDGHPVEIVRIHREEGVEFAAIRYLDGHLPYDVGGRLAGTEEEPIWEHRVLDGKVVRSNADYYYPERWVVEKGLRRMPEILRFGSLSIRKAHIDGRRYRVVVFDMSRPAGDRQIWWARSEGWTLANRDEARAWIAERSAS